MNVILNVHIEFFGTIKLNIRFPFIEMSVITKARWPTPFFCVKIIYFMCIFFNLKNYFYL